MRFKSRCTLEGANIDFVGIFERNLRFVRDRLRHSYSHLQSAGKLQRSSDERLALRQGNETVLPFHLSKPFRWAPFGLRGRAAQRYTRLKSVIEGEPD